MLDIQTLIKIADAYKVAANVENDSTVSYRVFGDSKKLGGLRAGVDITTTRFNSALYWFRNNWPGNGNIPYELKGLLPELTDPPKGGAS
jgi:hypothetical protein